MSQELLGAGLCQVVLQHFGCQKPGGRQHPVGPGLLPRLQVGGQFFSVCRHEGRDLEEQEQPLHMLCDWPRRWRRNFLARGCVRLMLQHFGGQRPGGRLHPLGPRLLPRLQVGAQFFALGRHDGRDQGEQERPRHMLGDGPRHCRRISQCWCRARWMLQPCGCQKPGGRLHPKLTLVITSAAGGCAGLCGWSA